MRLLELIQVDRPVTTKKRKLVPKPKRPGRVEMGMAKGHEHIARGQTARVFKSTKPGAVVRIGFLRSLDDPYLNFLKLILEHQDNPYFPRIYNAKLYRTGEKTGGAGDPVFQLIVEMEELLPVDDPKIADAMTHKLKELKVLPPNLSLSGHIARPKANIAIRQAFDHKTDMIINQTPDEQFAEALRVLQPLMYQHGLDLHMDNIMARLTGTGPQLVLVDPIIPAYFPYQGLPKEL